MSIFTWTNRVKAKRWRTGWPEWLGESTTCRHHRQREFSDTEDTHQLKLCERSTPSAYIQFYKLPCHCLRENFQRLQQDLAEMIVSSLEKRGDGSFKRTLSTNVHRRETSSSLQGDSSPEYFHLAVTDNPSTFLWLQRGTPYNMSPQADTEALTKFLWTVLFIQGVE